MIYSSLLTSNPYNAMITSDNIVKVGRDMAKRRLKKNVKISLIILVILIVLIIGIIIGVNKYKKHQEYLDSYEYKLSELGYKDDELNYLLEQTTEVKDIILNMEYNEHIVAFFKQKYFILKNLNSYLEYYNKNSSDSLEHIVSIVNVNANYDHYENTTETNVDDGVLMLVNKYHYLPVDYNPTDIVDVKNWYCYGENQIKEEVYQQFIEMFNAAKEDGKKIIISSGYRTYEDQKETYNNYVDRYGTKKADTLAARPGFSEHETGLTLDITTGTATKDTFEDTLEFKWLEENSYKYGFILRYPKDKEDITGYAYEPWHYRYVGVEIATKIHELDITFDEYYAYYLAD